MITFAELAEIAYQTVYPHTELSIVQRAISNALHDVEEPKLCRLLLASLSAVDAIQNNYRKSHKGRSDPKRTVDAKALMVAFSLTDLAYLSDDDFEAGVEAVTDDVKAFQRAIAGVA